MFSLNFLAAIVFASILFSSIIMFVIYEIEYRKDKKDEDSR